MGRVIVSLEKDKHVEGLQHFFAALECFHAIGHSRGQFVTLKDIHDID
jgi:hypothetical protein